MGLGYDYSRRASVWDFRKLFREAVGKGFMNFTHKRRQPIKG